jgi:signal transduction histidine kinase
VVGHVVLTIDASSQETLVCAESGLLEQVVLNLVMNARDASTAGSGVTIQTTRVALDHLQAMSLGVREGQYWVLSVTDHGEGMDSDTLSHAFEPFFTTKDPTRGTGLGLSIVYTIVTRLQGGIKVTSDRGKGSTFSIYLPRVSSTGAVATE